MTSPAGVSSTFELEERFKSALTLPLNEVENAEHRVWEDPELERLTQRDLDVLIARDMHGLAKADREELLQEVHGLGEIVPETRGLVLQHRLLMDRELSMLVSCRKATTGAFEKARYQNVAFVTSEEFQLLFLRATKWDAKEAANRMVDFFEAKKKLFGTNRLTKRIEISDLSKEDQKCLESGFIQLLPARDTAGRAVLALMVPLIDYKEAANMKRSFFYVIMVALEDIETQRRGIVIVCCNMGEGRRVNTEATFALHSIHSCLPTRLVSGHYCFDDFKLRAMLAVSLLLANASIRVRLRSHYGNPQNVLNQLSTYGIPVATLPITNDGESKSKYHRQWLRLRAALEKKQNTVAHRLVSLVVVPGRSDVLLGRGKPIQEHVGNRRYHALMDKYQREYEQAKKFEKRALVERIVKLVTEYGGRFLKQQDAGWLQVDHNTAREKVGHAFRTRRAHYPASTHTSTTPISPPTKSRVADSREGEGLDSISDCQSIDENPLITSIAADMSPKPKPVEFVEEKVKIHTARREIEEEKATIFHRVKRPRNEE